MKFYKAINFSVTLQCQLCDELNEQIDSYINKLSPETADLMYLKLSNLQMLPVLIC